jgi:hypothetical protein
MAGLMTFGTAASAFPWSGSAASGQGRERVNDQRVGIQVDETIDVRQQVRHKHPHPADQTAEVIALGRECLKPHVADQLHVDGSAVVGDHRRQLTLIVGTEIAEMEHVEVHLLVRGRAQARHHRCRRPGQVCAIRRDRDIDDGHARSDS